MDAALWACARVGDAAGGRRLRTGGVPAGGAGRRPRAAPCALSTPSSEHACCTRNREMSRARGRASDGWGRAFSVVRTRQARVLRERKRHCHDGGQMQQKRMPGATRRHAGLKRVLDTCRAAAPPAGDAACAEAAPRGGEAAARTPGALPAKDRVTQRRLRLAGQRAPRMGAPQPRRQGRPDRPAEPTVRGGEQPGSSPDKCWKDELWSGRVHRQAWTDHTHRAAGLVACRLGAASR